MYENRIIANLDKEGLICFISLLNHCYTVLFILNGPGEFPQGNILGELESHHILDRQIHM